MAEDLDKKIRQIADMFGVTDTNGIKNIVENFVPPDSGSSHAGPASEINVSSDGNSNNAGSSSQNNRSNPIDFGLLTKAGEMLSMLNSVQDSRFLLLNSVQPFLGPQRQQRLNGAVQLLKIVAAISTIAPAINRNTKV
jgi:hypothetical protein